MFAWTIADLDEGGLTSPLDEDGLTSPYVF